MLLGMLLVPSSLKAAITYTEKSNDFFSPAYFNNGSMEFGETFYGANFSNGIMLTKGTYTDFYNSNKSTSYTSIAIERYNWSFKKGDNNSSNDRQAGLQTQNNGKLAITGLRAGDYVRIEWADYNWDGATGVIKYYKHNSNVHCVQGNSGDIYDKSDYTITNGDDIYITSDGDLMIQGYNPVTITKIHIYRIPTAEFKYKPVGNNTTKFEFTKDGLLEVNDLALPYLLVSFGNENDYVVVNDLKSEMYRWNHTEDLELDGAFHPSKGNVYTFKPTGNGKITVSGTIVYASDQQWQNCAVRVFEYDPNGNCVRYNGNPYFETIMGSNGASMTRTFNVKAGYTYYVCEDNSDNVTHGAFHMNYFTFENTFKLGQLAKAIDINEVSGNEIELTTVTGATSGTVTVKRCTRNINNPYSVTGSIRDGKLYLNKPEFKSGTDNAGTIILDVKTNVGEATFVVTFAYHANYGTDPDVPGRTKGHTWNFIDPRNSDSNIGNSYTKNGDGFETFQTTGILSIGQAKTSGSQFAQEVAKREWTYAQRITGTAGGFHDPMYKNSFDMEGDNADMIWETEGLWFLTSPNLSCIYNENNAIDDLNKTNPLNFMELGTDPDRYVGLLPARNSGEVSKLTIPCLKDGDRVLIFMKSGEATGSDGIFLNVSGAKDAVGTPISSSDRYDAGGTNWQHNRYEGCYHFIKAGNGEMTFSMVGGSMAKILYIRIYSGTRINTNNVMATKWYEEEGTWKSDAGHLLFMNDKGATSGDYATLTTRFRGKGQFGRFKVLAFSGNLKPNSFTGDNFKISGGYNQNLDFTSKVGEIGMFRLRAEDIEYNKIYTSDFCDRDFTVGYRDKVDSYPYTWDFTDIQGYSSDAMSDEDENYSAADGSDELDSGNAAGFEISLFDANGYMKVNSGVYPEDCNIIFDPHKMGFGNQLWAGGDVIPETRGLWFYRDDNNSPIYNDCVQITSEGLCFANYPDAEGKRDSWWNMKMVVPDVPANAAVYLRMKRDSRVQDRAAKSNVLFLNTRFHFGEIESANEKTSLTEYSNPDTYATLQNGTNYSFYKVDGTDDEYILAIKNTTGATKHLTYTLNGWIVKKLAVSTDSKNIGSTGFATESRSRVIDHTLTGYMTGLPVKAYIVTSLGESLGTDKRAINVQEATVLPAGQGCFLANDMTADYDASADKSVKTLNGSTYLFAPDMHDSQMTITSNLMVANIAGNNISAQENGKINYALSNKHFSSDPSKPVYGRVNFYRVADGGATCPANGAYLQIPASSAAGVKAFYIMLEGAEDPLAEDFGNQDITGVKGIENAEAIEGNWYNMNGQKLNGRPTSSGIYVVNGKKVVIK